LFEQEPVVGFCENGDEEDLVLPVYDAASMGNRIPTFRGQVVSSSMQALFGFYKGRGLEWLNEYYLGQRNYSRESFV
jgi:hypothetical protein